MPPTNEFLPFCPADTGSNLLSESDYTAAADRVSGNKPGVASSKLNNKALRQSAYVASQLAQYILNTTGTDVLDDATPAKLLAQFNATFERLPMIQTDLLSGTGTFSIQYVIYIASGNATAGATYTNNGFTFTVVNTVSAATKVYVTGTGAPSASGTFTKASGTGDATLTAFAVRAPGRLHVKLVGAGGGGGGAGVGSGVPNAGGAGGATTFGSSLLQGSGGGGGLSGDNGGAGGAASLGTNPQGIARVGSGGGAGAFQTIGTVYQPSGMGGCSPFGGSGRGKLAGPAGDGGGTNTGSGGSGGSGTPAANLGNGGGGGSGGYVEADIFSPASQYSYGIGAAGLAGTAGTSGAAGGTGGNGFIHIEMFY